MRKPKHYQDLVDKIKINYDESDWDPVSINYLGKSGKSNWTLFITAAVHKTTKDIVYFVEEVDSEGWIGMEMVLNSKQLKTLTKLDLTGVELLYGKK